MNEATVDQIEPVQPNHSVNIEPFRAEISKNKCSSICQFSPSRMWH